MKLKYFLVSSLLLVVSLQFVATMATGKDEDYNQVKKEVDEILKQMENEQEQEHAGHQHADSEEIHHPNEEHAGLQHTDSEEIHHPDEHSSGR